MAPFVHLYVARGAVEAAGTLAAGDAARITLSEGRRLTAPAASAGAEGLAWAFGGAG